MDKRVDHSTAFTPYEVRDAIIAYLRLLGLQYPADSTSATVAINPVDGGLTLKWTDMPGSGP